jgi:hypothetical protein
MTRRTSRKPARRTSRGHIHVRRSSKKTRRASLRRNDRTYYSVRIPFSKTPTVWHPDKPTGPFNVLDRGAFRTVQEAHDWAHEHLGRKPVYTVVPHTLLENSRRRSSLRRNSNHATRGAVFHRSPAPSALVGYEYVSGPFGRRVEKYRVPMSESTYRQFIKQVTARFGKGPRGEEASFDLGLPIAKNSRRVTAKNRNLYRLQDVYYYIHDRYDFKMTPHEALVQARKALRDAGVVIPRGVKSGKDLWHLAKKFGDAHGFDAHAGEYRKKS